MPARKFGAFVRRPSLPLALLIAFMATLWLAGGASRADMLGQVVVRMAACAAIITTLVFAPPLKLAAARPAAFILAGSIALILLQLVPLPPAIWEVLPGRGPLAGGTPFTGEAIWRPLAIVPDAGINAALSMLVPTATLLLLLWTSSEGGGRLPVLLLALILASMFLGLLQFSGASFSSPLINDGGGQVSGSFANRNHFALFLAIGCAIVPVWAFAGGRRSGWRGVAAVGTLLIFVLMILASGSRAGLLLGGLGLLLGLAIVRRNLRNELRRAPRWAFPVMLLGIVGLIVMSVFVSISAGRAEAIDRAFSVSASEDMRTRGLPSVIAAVRDYFPAGSGFGGFDPIFRIGEPLELLQVSYFNHAHNEYMEIAFDGGLPGILLLASALIWWLSASLRAWRAGDHPDRVLPQLGSTILFLVIIASAVDYPARTPMMMAVVVIAATWLGMEGLSMRLSHPSHRPPAV